MSQFTNCGRSEVSSVARGVLRAFERGAAADRQTALAEAGLFIPRSAPRDACEAERLDVLRSAVEALNGPRAERVQAGLYLLEHLADGTGSLPAEFHTF
jgi:hypothetical protein